MQGKYKVVTLCDSTKFKNEFLETQKRLTLEGNIVISVGLFGHSGDKEVWTPCIKDMLDDMHLRKINMADIFWRNLCKILRLCQGIVLSIVSRLIYRLVIWLNFVWSFGLILLGHLA